MKDMYRLILDSKGYVHDKRSDFYIGVKGSIYRIENNDEAYYLIDVNKGNKTESYTKEDLMDYKRAVALIRIFCINEYGSQSVIRRLTHIPIAFTEYEEEGHEVQVYLNMIELNMSFYFDKFLVDRINYSSIAELVHYELSFLDFDTLVSLEEEWNEVKVTSEEYLKDRSQPLTFSESCQFISSLVNSGLIKRDYREGYENNILIYRKAGKDEEKDPEGWYSEDFLETAKELFDNPESQKGLWEVIDRYPGYEPVFHKVEKAS